MSVVAGVEHEIAQLPEDLRASGLAAVALAMAERIDGGKGSPSECAKALMEALTKLRDLRPPSEEKDQLDELSERRERRIAGGANPKA